MSNLSGKKLNEKQMCVCDIVTDGEVQHMQITSFQQEYISSVYDLSKKD